VNWHKIEPMPRSNMPNRRGFLAAGLGASVFSQALAQQAATQISPTPAPRDWSGNTPLQYPDPDIMAIDNRFRRYIVNSPIRRHYTGTLWSEGPAWNGVGRYLVWSDIPNNVQLRWIEEDSRVTVFRNPSGYSNGNTFDYEGRQLSCEHGGRRVVRYEQSGAVTVIADKFQGKRLNSPNDIVVHPDGSIWFTDPTYGINGNFEGFKADKEIKQAVYRVDAKTAQIEKVFDECDQPNGLCFSPDYKKLYLVDTGAPLDIKVFDVDGKTLAGLRPPPEEVDVILGGDRPPPRPEGRLRLPARWRGAGRRRRRDNDPVVDHGRPLPQDRGNP